MGIANRPRLPHVREVFLGGAVEPSRRRWIVYPGMIWPSVIRDLILDDFEAE